MISGSTFNLSGSDFAFNTRDWLVFDGNFSTALDGTLTIELGSSDSQWMMLDEVRFTAVPEPAETSVLISLATAGALVIARRKRRRSPDAA